MGKNVEGKTFIIEDEEVVAQKGAEIFNNYLYNIATGYYSHAEGDSTKASGWCSHAEGMKTKATTTNDDVSTTTIKAKGYYTHAEGYGTVAYGAVSHAEGNGTKASGTNSHSEGKSTVASGNCSHSEGYCTVASGENQHVQGKFNIDDIDADGNPLNTYAHIVGNGVDSNRRSNAHTLDWDGNAWFAGDIYVGSTSGTNRDEGSKKLATIPTDEEMVIARDTKALVE